MDDVRPRNPPLFALHGGVRRTYLPAGECGGQIAFRQGRNFSYLDTQTERLGGPNFTHIPINAPKCPMHHFQQDSHMAMHNPKGRANYEPNSWGEDGGPRENP